MSGDAWQERHAAMIDHEIAEVEKLLVELENGETLGEVWNEDGLVTATRSLAAWWRSAIATKRGEARDLRASIAETTPALPMTVTRRIG